ncbi:MAG: putative molybdenum carrier protein [Armatimonadota bacterium]
MLKIISGGQEGVDLAALRAAKRAGFQTGGYMTSDFATSGGKRPEYEHEYGMVARPVMKSPSAAYVDRTRANVKASDLTILIATDLASRGSIATQRAADDYKKQCVCVGVDPKMLDLDKVMTEHKDAVVAASQVIAYTMGFYAFSGAKVINFAGNRSPELGELAEAMLSEIFRSLRDRIAERLVAGVPA